MTTPYRDGKKLDDVIPPDRRRQRATMMIIGGMVGGAVLIEGAHVLMSPSAEPAPAPVVTSTLSEEEISRVVAQNKADLRDRCFNAHPELEKASVTIDLNIASNGEVQSTHYEGTDGRVTACVDREVRKWQFPKHGLATAKTRIPFVFERMGGR